MNVCLSVLLPFTYIVRNQDRLFIGLLQLKNPIFFNFASFIQFLKKKQKIVRYYIPTPDQRFVLSVLFFNIITIIIIIYFLITFGCI